MLKPAATTPGTIARPDIQASSSPGKSGLASPPSKSDTIQWPRSSPEQVEPPYEGLAIRREMDLLGADALIGDLPP